MNQSREIIGRFAPSPSGRMHLGNLFTALISWLAVRSVGGRWILRIEDLDPQRSKASFAHAIEEDLLWLGLDWDEGGVANRGPHPPYCQSLASDLYTDALNRLIETGLVYVCRCTRADLNATNAPHSSDGRLIYPGTCRPTTLPAPLTSPGEPHSLRLAVPDLTISFNDIVFGPVSTNLVTTCGDFVLRRADLAWAYQLAVVVDDARMNVTQVVRGADLLLSSAQQIYLYSLLGLPVPDFAHLPLISNTQGRRLSKRDQDLSLSTLRRELTPSQVLVILARLAGMPVSSLSSSSVTPRDLIPLFSWSEIPRQAALILPENLNELL